MLGPRGYYRPWRVTAYYPVESWVKSRVRGCRVVGYRATGMKFGADLNCRAVLCCVV